MKKILTAIIAVILVLPFVVKADAVVVHTYYNSKVMVDGEVEVHIPCSYITDYELTITYDKNYLSTSKDRVTVFPKTSIVNTDGKDGTVENKFDITYEEGKITLKGKFNEQKGVIGDAANPEINIKFTALKVGTTKIKIGGHVLYENETTEIKIVENTCSGISSSDDGDTTEPSTPEPAPEPKDKDEVEEVKPAKEEKRNKDLVLYISLGANALLLIALIIVAAKKKKNKVEE